MRPERLFRIGATFWIALGIGHGVLVDLLTFALRTRPATVTPSDTLTTMQETTIDFGSLGASTAYRASAGFSLWITISLVVLGAIYWLLAAQPGVRLKPFAAIGVIASAAFLVLSITCFIYPPLVASAVAMTAFAGAWAYSPAP